MPVIPRMLPAAGYARLVSGDEDVLPAAPPRPTHEDIIIDPRIKRWGKDSIWDMPPEVAGIYQSRADPSGDEVVSAPRDKSANVMPSAEDTETRQRRQLIEESTRIVKGEDYVIPGWLLRPDRPGEEPLRRAEDEERLRRLLPAANAMRGKP